MVLNYKCNNCGSEPLQYYNPCALLLHSRRHYTPFGGQVNLDDIQVLCLPYGLIGFPPHPDIPMLYNVTEEDANGTNVNTRFYAPIRANKGKNVITMVPTILLFYHYKLNGTPPASLVLKQVSTNVPKCVFVRLEQNNVSANAVVPPSIERRLNAQMSIAGGVQQISDGINEISSEESNESNINNNNNSKESSASGNVNNEIRKELNGKVDATVPANEKIVCPECRETISPDKDLTSHFVNTNPLIDEFLCEVCSYIAASSCSYSAHKRLHFRESPYVCPECGKEFKDNMSLLDHMEETCFHLAKQVRLRCPKKNCCKVFAQQGTFMTHFEVHIQTLNKCTLCDASFYAVRDFVEHGHTVHSSLVPVELIYKCTLCKNSALQTENYQEHINMHCIDTNLRVYVYICKLCRNFFRSAVTYAAHIVRCSKKETTMEELRRLKKCNTSIVCLHCNYIVRLVTRLYDCPRCGKTINPAFTPSFDKKGLPICDNNRLKCVLCHEEFNTHESQNAHECVYKYPIVILNKEDEWIQRIITTKTIPYELKCDTSKRKRRRTSPSPTKFKRPAPINYAMLQLDAPIQFEGTYACRVCDYQNASREEFHRHIKEHKDISTAYQCMECGECFVVKPSFHKHLMYYHKISNVDEYVKQNECVDHCAISELEKHMRIESGEISEDVAENQCKVCLKQFDDLLELNKHFRMHGMAFLRDNK